MIHSRSIYFLGTFVWTNTYIILIFTKVSSTDSFFHTSLNHSLMSKFLDTYTMKSSTLSHFSSTDTYMNSYTTNSN